MLKSDYLFVRERLYRNGDDLCLASRQERVKIVAQSLRTTSVGLDLERCECCLDVRAQVTDRRSQLGSESLGRGALDDCSSVGEDSNGKDLGVEHAQRSTALRK